MGRLVALAALVLAAGCADLGEVPFYCCKDCNPQCPDGYDCKGAYCVKKGSCPDFVPGCASTNNCGNGTCDAGEDKTSCPADCAGGTCGDTNCEPSESCTSCPADCGQCPANCGNGTCDAGETPQSCPADCKSTGCGNGTCDAGETTATCPADCPATGCTQDQTQCVGTDSLKYCDANAWKTETCEALCKARQFDYGAGCEFDATKQKDICMCGVYGTMGELCDVTVKCDPSLKCIQFDAARPGFCSKACTSSGATCSGAPSGTLAECVLELTSGGLACGFVCDLWTSCPTGMTCDSASQLCKP